MDGNCFDHEFWFQNGKVFHTLPTQEKPKPADRPFTKVLMNPPFSLKSASEDKFVDYALRQTSPGSKLFAVIPTRLISGGDKAAKWRKNLLERHTLKAVIRFDKNLFYPVNVSTYGMILETHRPHEDDDKVFMGVLFDDEHRPRRSKLLSVNNLGDNVDEMTKELRRFLLGKPLCKEIVPREQGVFTLNLANNFDLSPQSYLPNGEVRNFNATTRILGLLSAQRMVQTKNTKLKTRIDDGVNLKHFPLSIFFETELQAPLKTLKDCEEGAVPVVSATATNNGITAWKDIHSDYILENCITISKTHNTSPCQAFWHPYKFTAISTVIVVEPVEKLLKNPMAILFLCQAITQGNSWKYDYSRPVQLSELEVFVPCKTKGEKKHKREVPDIEKMADLMIIQMSEIENKQFEGIDHDIDDLNEILAT